MVIPATRGGSRTARTSPCLSVTENSSVLEVFSFSVLVIVGGERRSSLWLLLVLGIRFVIGGNTV